MSTQPEAHASATHAVRPGLAYLLAAVAMVIYSSPPAVTRAVTGAVPPLALSLSRWVIAFVILLPFALRPLARDWHRIRGRIWPLVGLVLPMIIGSTMSVLAVYYTTATNAVLVNASQPAVTAGLGWLIAGTILSGRQKLGIACAFTGIVVMIVQADLNRLLTFQINVGDFIMLLAVVGWSLYAVLLNRVEDVPRGALLMFLISIIGMLVLLPLATLEYVFRGGFAFTQPVVGAMFFLAIFPTILATVAWNAAIRSVGANRTAIFVNLIPVSGAALAVAFLGESLYPYHLIGAAFVIVGIFLAVRRR